MAIRKRGDVNPERGEHEYGNVAFADPTNKKYPIDSADHVRAAWAYINKRSNAAKYSHKDAEEIRNRIRQAASRFDIDIESDDS